MICAIHDEQFATEVACPWCVVAVRADERDLAREEAARAEAKLKSFEEAAEARIVELEEAARLRLRSGHDALCESLDSRFRKARPCTCGYAELSALVPDD